MEYSSVKIMIDGKEVMAREGQTVAQAARENHIFIPTLCDYQSLNPAGTCRICTVKIGGRLVTSCGTTVSHGMVIENESPELRDIRKGIIEMLFVEGNHMCPSCEKSGNCELQAMAYRYRMSAPRFPFLFPNRKIDAELPHLIIEHTRCIQCLRCVRGVRAKDGHELFGFIRRGQNIRITVDSSDPEVLTEETAQAAMDICPVGALIKKKNAYAIPIGKRKYDVDPIGTSVEKKRSPSHA